MPRRTVLLTVLGAFGLLLVPVAMALPEAASPRMERWNSLFMQIFWVALAVGILVNVLLVYALVRFRARKGGPKEGPHIHGNTKMEVAWTIAPTVVMAWLLFVSWHGLFDIEDPTRETDFTVKVTAYRFGWTFEYPDGTVATNGTLRVEQNQVVGLEIRSEDVIHAFSVHELSVMKDAVPGRTNYDWFQATIPGVYEVRCREFCGVGHSRMLADVYIFPEGSEFDEATGESRHYGWPPPPPPPPPPPVNETGNQTGNQTPAAEGRVIEIQLGPGLTISPDQLMDIPKGETVTFDVVNVDRIPHNFYIGPRFDINQPNGGAQWFTPQDGSVMRQDATDRLVVKDFNEDATYEIWCNVGGHYQGGMRGLLKVGTGGAGFQTKEPLLPGFEAFVALGALAAALVALRRRR